MPFLSAGTYSPTDAVDTGGNGPFHKHIHQGLFAARCSTDISQVSIVQTRSALRTITTPIMP